MVSSSDLPLATLGAQLRRRRAQRATGTPRTKATVATPCRNGRERNRVMRRLKNGTTRSYYVCPRALKEGPRKTRVVTKRIASRKGKATASTTCANGMRRRPVMRNNRTYYVCPRGPMVGPRKRIASRSNKATAATPCNRSGMIRRPVMRNGRRYFVCVAPRRQMIKARTVTSRRSV